MEWDHYTYIWQREGWANWQYSLPTLMEKLTKVHYQQGLLLGRMCDVGLIEREQISLQMLTGSVVKSSEIEGEMLNVQSVRSSIAKRLGIDIGGLQPVDRFVEGVVEMTLDATQNYAEPLSTERLFGWHAALFPTGYSGMSKIKVAAFRDDKDGAMQVISGRMGKSKVHFQAPPAENLPEQVAEFLAWINQTPLDLFIKAGIAHLWFLTLHPFEDGNGRIARAITDSLLAQADNQPQRFYSLSAQIQQVRSEYYEILENTQKGDGDITNWLAWFLDCIVQAMENAQQTLDQVLIRTAYWAKWNKVSLNPRQIKVLTKLLDQFEGKLTNKKYAALTKVSRDTALRDLTDLVEKGILVRSESGGRSVGYELVAL